MRQQVTVRIRSEQTDADGNRETAEECRSGEFIRMNGKGYLTYEEPDTGSGGARVTLKTDGERVYMLRHAPSPARLSFQKDERVEGVYQTPCGALYLTTHTHEMSVRCDVCGEIRLVYTLLSGDEPLMHTTLLVRWEER